MLNPFIKFETFTLRQVLLFRKIYENILKKLECSSTAYFRVKKGHAVINFIQIGLHIFGPDMCGNGRSVKSYLANNRKKRVRIIIIIIITA